MSSTGPASPETEKHCLDCGELNPQRARFCLECGGRFESTGPPSITDGSPVDLVDALPQVADDAGERRIVSVLFADLSGFTAYSEGSDVEDVRTIAQETANQLGDIVVRYGGTVDKIIGDCVMAIWGAPTAHEDDPERAVRAALDMQACVAEHAQRFAGLALCVGIQTGEAMWAPVGADGLYTVLGDTVNTAARLQGAAAKGEVIIGAPTFEAVAGAIETEELEPIKAKNKAEPVPAFRAVAVKGERTKHKPAVAALAGRDAELHRLRELWERVTSDAKPYGVTLLGAPGVGKSRLVSSFTDALGPQALVLRGRCLAYGEGITYWPIVEIIQTAAGIQHDDDQPTVSTKLGALLEGLGSEDLDELRTMAVALANVIGAPTTPRGTYTATEISRGELHWGLRRILELAARSVPAVLVIEDLHWAEPTLIELLGFFLSSDAGAPILVVTTGRPEAEETAATLTSSATGRLVQLDALGDEAARSVTTELLGAAALDAETVDQVLRAAGGNPLFLEELALLVREAESGTDVATLVKQLASSGNVQGLIDTRLDALPTTERRVLTHASVIGDVFWPGTIAYLDEGDEGLAEALDSLERRDLVRPLASTTVGGQTEYAFKHALIRDAAYRRLTKKERASLHQRCGRWIAELPAGQDEFAEIIAYHLEQACTIAADLSLTEATAPMLDAARALTRAGEKAEAREGMREAERFLARAANLLGDRYAETAIDVSMRRARILTGLGRLDEARTVLTDVTEQAVTLGRPDIRGRAVLSLAEIAAQTGDVSDARTHLDEGERIGKELRDTDLRIRAMQIRSIVAGSFDGDTAAAIEGLQGAIALAEEVSDEESALYARTRLAAMYFNAGELEPAYVHFTRCDEMARARGSLRVQSWIAAILGLIHHHRGPREDAGELFTKAAAWLERTNDPYMRAQTLCWHGLALLTRNEPQEALRILRTADHTPGEIGSSLFVNIASATAEALARLGRTAEAREVAATARAEAPDEDPLAQANALVADGFAAFASGDEAGARRTFQQAFPILERGSKIDLGETRLRYAALLEALGDAAAASDQLERARDTFAEVGAAASVDAAERELARLRDVELGTASSRRRPQAASSDQPV